MTAPSPASAPMQGLAHWLRAEEARYKASLCARDPSVLNHVNTLSQWAAEVEAAAQSTGAPPAAQPTLRLEIRQDAASGWWCIVSEPRTGLLIANPSLELCLQDILPSWRFLAKHGQIALQPPAAKDSPSDAIYEQRLLGVLAAVQRYLPPGGVSAHDTLSAIIALVDPWPAPSDAAPTARPLSESQHGLQHGIGLPHAEPRAPRMLTEWEVRQLMDDCIGKSPRDLPAAIQRAYERINAGCTIPASSGGQEGGHG